MSQHTLEICKCKYFVTLDKYLSCMRFLSGETELSRDPMAVQHSCVDRGPAPSSRVADLCNTDQHTCSVPCISKALQFSSARCTAKSFSSMLDSCAADVQPTADSNLNVRVKGGRGCDEKVTVCDPSFACAAVHARSCPLRKPVLACAPLRKEAHAKTVKPA